MFRYLSIAHYVTSCKHHVEVNSVEENGAPALDGLIDECIALVILMDVSFLRTYSPLSADPVIVDVCFNVLIKQNGGLLDLDSNSLVLFNV